MKRFLRFLPLALLILLAAGLLAGGLGRVLSLEALRTHEAALRAFIAAHRIVALLAFVVLYMVATATSLPGATILTLAGGYLFGTWLGGGATVIGATLGAVIVFFAVQTSLGAVLRDKAERSGGKLKAVIDGVEAGAFGYILTLRLIPLAPFWLVNVAAALAGAPLRAYAGATFVGIMPATFIYSGIGAGIGEVVARGQAPDLRVIFRAPYPGPSRGPGSALLGHHPLSALAGALGQSLMTRKSLKADMVVIGAGSGGLSVASGAAQLGLKVVLFEKGEMGGDCLNYGCVPSKAFIAAADVAHVARTSSELGLDSGAVSVEFTRVMAHVHQAIAAIAPNDSQARFEGLGVQVVRDTAFFLDPRTVATDDVKVTARKIIIATGSRAVVPPIPGLAETPYLTNETIFELVELPKRLIVLGGGPIGIELGQAFRRLGSEVVIIDAGAMLGREDPRAADVVLQQLLGDGVELCAGHKAVRVDPGPSILVEGPEGQRRIEGSHLLVAVGRTPNLEALDLRRGKVAFSRQGVTTDASLRSTTNRHVFAVGDVAGRGQFTHLAGAHAALVVRRAVFGLPVNAEALALPRVTYCDPELAAIGLSEADARKAHGDDLRIEQIAFGENDRAQAEGDIRGFGKLVTTAKGKVLGVTLVGRHAGDHIAIWALAMSAGLKLSKLTGMIAPYPTRGEINKRLAGQWYTPALFSERTRRLVWVLKHLI
jgi:pyruvate/2-oxoglutarate dehydrogenase complex dihydrolipoamide dehydrogenase (E3) component/uncharacterized membrane protein YdjX (TVP38/TMEM64 family)